jgi:hypothetical protein
VVEFRGFKEVKGKRGNLPEFSGVGRQPAEDMRLISTLGFVNLPDEVTTPLRVPLLFLYRGEVVPSFPLQAVLLWMRITPAEVKIELGSHIELPGGKTIPIGSDGTVLVHPNGETKARRVTLNELLLATQNREAPNETDRTLSDLREHVVLARTPTNPLAPPDVFRGDDRHHPIEHLPPPRHVAAGLRASDRDRELRDVCAEDRSFRSHPVRHRGFGRLLPRGACCFRQVADLASRHIAAGRDLAADRVGPDFPEEGARRRHDSHHSPRH